MRAQNRELLWIAPRWPLPADDGARVAMVSLINSLSQAGARIDLVSLCSADEATDATRALQALDLRSLTPIVRPFPKPIQRLAHFLRQPSMPLTIAPFSLPRIAETITGAVRAQPRRIVVHDGLHAAGWLARLAAPLDLPPLVLRAHNVEHSLWRQAADRAGNPFTRVLLRQQMRAMRHFESRVLAASHLAFPVSREDGTALSLLSPQTTIIPLPIGIPGAAAGSPTSEPDPHPTFLFVGRLDWPPNKEGLRWLLSTVWPVLGKDRLPPKLLIVGSGDAGWLAPFADQPGIELHGRVPTVEPFYRRSMASLVPVFYGSGTRVKVIEASRFGRVCISTQIGVEGVGLRAGETYLEATSAEDWVASIRALTHERAMQMGSAAALAVGREFDPAALAERFLAALETIDPPRDALAPAR